MGLLTKIAGLWRGSVKSGLINIPDFLSYPGVKSGVAVTWRSALEVSAVLACVRAIGDGLSQTPLRFYDGSQDRLARVKDHPLEALFRRPNRWQTEYEFRETLAIHAALTGNAFVFVNRVGPSKARRIQELIPISPGRVTVYRKADLSLEYHVAAEVPDQSGLSQGLSQLSSGDVTVFPQEMIWHFRGPSWNSWMGLEPVKLAREAIGLAIATEAAHAMLHKNGVQPGALYSVDGKLSEEQHEKLKGWIEKHVAGDNLFKPLVLDMGAKYASQAMTGVDAQHLETRRFQIEEICRAFRVNPIIAGYSDKTSTYASAEQMFIAHVVHCIAPWAKRFEDSARCALLAPDDPTVIRLHLNGLMRGAARDRSDFYAKALGHGGGQGWMTPNEVREDEGLDWMEGEDAIPAAVAGASAADAPPNDPAADGTGQ
ncbi:MAG: phage portal protein [Methylocystis sp.]|uniref:phage portal protein n=1 Tax=Methylocystis sp. TaxID=1911079 RepID=UPI003DA5EF1C